MAGSFIHQAGLDGRVQEQVVWLQAAHTREHSELPQHSQTLRHCRTRRHVILCWLVRLGPVHPSLARLSIMLQHVHMDCTSCCSMLSSHAREQPWRLQHGQASLTAGPPSAARAFASPHMQLWQASTLTDQSGPVLTSLVSCHIRSNAHALRSPCLQGGRTQSGRCCTRAGSSCPGPLGAPAGL